MAVSFIFGGLIIGEKDGNIKLDVSLENETGDLIPISNPIPFCAYKPNELERIAEYGPLFAEGRTKMVIDPKGNIVIDYCMRDKVGNILQDDILKCWQSETMNKIRGNDYLPDECKKCKLLDQCCGGSRFATKIYYGEFGKLDPLARPEKYKEYLFDE